MFIQQPNIDVDLINFIEAQAIVHEISPNVALRIANCESSMNPKAKNKNSTASGLYQFTISTWEWLGYTDKDRFDAYWSTIAFMNTYKKYPNYWVCK